MVFDGCLFKSTQDLPGTALSLKQMRVILVLLTQSFLASLLIRQIILVIIMRSFICQTAQLILNGNKFRFFQRGCLLLVFVGFPESCFGLRPGQKSEKGFCRNSHVCNTEKNSTIDFIFFAMAVTVHLIRCALHAETLRRKVQQRDQEVNNLGQKKGQQSTLTWYFGCRIDKDKAATAPVP